jgi:Flp pilus assembly protein TadD
LKQLSQTSLERAVNDDPEDKESWSNLGCLFFMIQAKDRKKQNVSRATRCFQQAISVDRNDARSWHNAGVAAEKIGALSRADVCYAAGPPRTLQEVKSMSCYAPAGV